MRNLIKFKNSWLYIITVVLIIILGFLSYYFSKLGGKSEELVHPSCLASTEEVQYEAYESEDGSSSAKIFIKNKNTSEIIYEFEVENIVPSHYRPYEAHRCGVYLVREFNFNYTKRKPLPDFRMEVWVYYYDGSGEKLAEENDFRVDSNERYLVIKRGYLGQPDYAIVIKNLDTKEDIFVLPLKDITDRYPSLVGDIGLREWTKDGRYFWGEIFIGAYTLGFFRVDTVNWHTEIFEVPEGVLGGSALNIEKGYVTLHPDQIWIGIQEHYEQIKKERQEQGKISSLYLYNLFAREQILVATTSEPLWFFKPKWLSDIELEYELPSGEKKIYTIK